MQDRTFAAEAIGLVKRYGEVVAVNGISLQIRYGEVFGLLGPNGAGKTTTIGMMLGVLKPSAGEVRLFGERLFENERRLLPRVGALVETPTFYPYLGARDNLRVLAKIDGKTTGEAIEETLRITDLVAAADRPFRTYSLGMKQRLGIAAALLASPELIILDEPTNGLDPAGIVEIRSLLRELAQRGKAVVLSSHQLNEVQRICDRVAIVNGGEIVAEGTVSSLIGGRQTVRATVSDVHLAVLLIERLPWVTSLKVHEDQLEIGGEPPDPFELSRTLSASGVWVRSLAAAEPTLENVFLSITSTNGTRKDGLLETRSWELAGISHSNGATQA
jgi:ABC-2 type transport system ATP-binding protein